MLTVLHLLSHTMFRNFSLVSDASGLYNSVTGTGIWDWESKEDIEATFFPGEFILTTLSLVKENGDAVDEYMKTLIDKHVAAIAIKNVHHRQISHQTITYANRYHIPIFMFTDTFIDDLIYTIKTSLIAGNLEELHITKLQEIMTSKSTAAVRTLINELNPFFKENCICCCCTPKEKETQEKILGSYYESYHELVKIQRNVEHATHLLIKGKRFLFLIYSSTSDPSALKHELLHLMSALELSEKEFRLGFSLPKGELTLLHQALWEALYSAVTCVIDHETYLDYHNIGINQFLMPLANSDWMKNFYTERSERLKNYDKEHHTNLHDTLVQYIQCDADITLTADRLYQHSNTIRYRLARIKDILEINNNTEANIQLYIYGRLFAIYQNLQPNNFI